MLQLAGNIRVHMMKKILLAALLVPGIACAQGQVIQNKDKLDDDPTKVITKVGVSYANNFDFDDSNVAFSGSLALDDARKLNARVNHDASEWRIGGSWLFPVGIVNFNFGKNEYTNGATQTNYSVGSFMPLSYFGIEPAGIQLFPMAGYTYNDGESPKCGGNTGDKCASENFNGTPSPENGFNMVTSSSHSGYLGAFGLKALTPKFTLLGFVAGSYGSKNDEGENYKGAFGGLGGGYRIDKNNSMNAFVFMQDNNTYLDEADKRIVASYTYQFD
ncbi:hypothetical protein SAMN04488136_11392 [Vibrio xiamenensis]|uniref:MetA-pathway of phenol degradation n=2 Tax=Vibrio xiamenensis TaxID=861298 RepID=A0A1G8BIU5_9VIBR|nr:hypothetical protein SAMN04488136_11392 [Vibrio xiamenensis]